MLEVTELRNGTYFEENGTPYLVLSYEHIKMGRRGATIKVKVRNLLTHAVIVKSFQSGKRVNEADIEKISAYYKYRTGTECVFANENDEFYIDKNLLSDELPYLVKNMKVQLVLYKDEPISVILPVKYNYKVKDAPPDARGNSANASTKEVILENNLKVKTPMFIKAGDIICIDTRDGTYVSRING